MAEFTTHGLLKMDMGKVYIMCFSMAAKCLLAFSSAQHMHTHHEKFNHVMTRLKSIGWVGALRLATLANNCAHLFGAHVHLAFGVIS
jgi:hypothetical protein